MVAIGGKTKKAKAPTQPQFVIQTAEGVNLFARLHNDDKGEMHVLWIGDPNAATKFDSKCQAKFRTREIHNIPETRVFKPLEMKGK